MNIFKDRLEITSPGSLPGVRELKKEKNISSIIPRRRNDVICAVLEMCRFMEAKSSGFDKIEQDYGGRGESHKPFISSDAVSFTLTLPDLTFRSGVIDENTIPDVYPSGLLPGKNDNRILSYCYPKERTVKEISEYLGLTSSSYFRHQVLSRLVDDGYLLEDSADGAVRYMSNKEKVFI